MRLQAAVGSTPLASAAQRDRFVQWLRLGQDGAGVRLHAYAVLPQAALLLLTPQTAADLSRYVQALARQASRASATPAAHDGAPATVWAGRFQSALVQPDGTLKLPDNQQNLVIRTSYSDIQRGADGTLRIASPVIQGNVSGNVTLYVEGRGVENITVLNSR